MTRLTRLAKLGVAALLKAQDEASLGRILTEDDGGSPRVPAEVPDVDSSEESPGPQEAVREAISILESSLSGGGISGEERRDITRALPLLKAGVEGEDIPVSVKAVIKDSEGRVLVLRDAYSEFWDLPGGHVMAGETMEAALQRELEEETGLEMTGCQQFDTQLLKLGDQFRPTMFYEVECIAGQPRISEEHLGYQWADGAELNVINLGVYKDILIPGAESSEVLEGYGEPALKVSGRLQVPHYQVKEEAGGGGIADVGSPMTSADTQTPVGGGGRRRKLKSLVDSASFKHFQYYLRHLAKTGKGVVETGDETEQDASAERWVEKPVGGHQQLKMIKSLVPRQSPYDDLQVLHKSKDGRGRFVVAGYASPVVVDQEGHRISHSALAEGLPKFMALDGKYANVNLLHSNVTVGKVIPEYTNDRGETFKTQVDEVGLYTVTELRTDQYAPPIVAQVIKDIEDGKLRSFSISANADNPVFMCDDNQCYYDIGKVDFYEITICQDGVNQEAKFNVVSKAA